MAVSHQLGNHAQLAEEVSTARPLHNHRVVGRGCLLWLFHFGGGAPSPPDFAAIPCVSTLIAVRHVAGDLHSKGIGSSYDGSVDRDSSGSVQHGADMCQTRQRSLVKRRILWSRRWG